MVIQKYLAELVGTFILVLIGSMAAVSAIDMGSPALVVVPLGFGLGLMAAMFAVGHVSGGHFNPAVTVAVWLDKRIDGTDVIGYLIGQFAGAMIAAAVVLGAAGQGAVAATVARLGDNGAQMALLVEFVLTLVFVLVFLTACRRAPAAAMFAVPFTYTAIHMAGLPFSGAIFNPARAFGVTVMGGRTADLWAYLVGPIAGGAIAWVLWKMFGTADE